MWYFHPNKFYSCSTASFHLHRYSTFIVFVTLVLKCLSDLLKTRISSTAFMLLFCSEIPLWLTPPPHLVSVDIRPSCELSGECRGFIERISCFPAPHPFVADLQHLGEEEQQQVGPGLSVALWGQGQEVRYRLAAHATTHTEEHEERKTNHMRLREKVTRERLKAASQICILLITWNIVQGWWRSFWLSSG